MKPADFLKLAAAVAVSLLAGGIGSVFTTPAISGWYAELAKPALTPPGWVFGPVWTALYLLMGLAAFLVWRKGLRSKEVKTALGLFIAQLALNTLWSVIFFGLRSPGAALAGIAVLWLAILATMIAFAKVSRLSAWLLLPYILWVSFAAYLNFGIWMLN